MLRRFALGALAALALVLVPACQDPVNQETFDQITVGMDITEVESIMGGSGELQEASGVGIGASGLMEMQGGEGRTKDYLWGDENVGILVKFKEGKVVHKQKMGF